jgi:predicted PurR-regulated permease PerM
MTDNATDAAPRSREFRKGQLLGLWLSSGCLVSLFLVAWGKDNLPGFMSAHYGAMGVSCLLVWFALPLVSLLLCKRLLRLAGVLTTLVIIFALLFLALWYVVSSIHLAPSTMGGG